MRLPITLLLTNRPIMSPSKDITETLLGRGLPAAIAVARDLRRRVQALARHGRHRPDQLLRQARIEIAKREPLLALTIRDSLLAAWLGSADKVTHGVASRQADSPFVVQGPPIKPPPLWPRTPDMPEPEPVVRFPQIDAAVRDLQAKRLLTQAEFNVLDQDARRAAFTIARLGSTDAIGKVREALADDLRDGGSLRDFRLRISDAIAGSGLGEHQVEAVYRTQVAQAYSAGQKDILDHPLVADEFPYLLWTATHDSRTRPDHLAMEHSGQNGTAVYRRDDPIWQTLYPPAGWNCRCMVIPLSIEDAAKHGSREAAKWLKTGQPPITPVFAARPYPITPPAGWPVHDRIESVV